MSRPAHHTAFAREVEATFTPEHTPTYRLDELVRKARREMGEERWAQLQAEWEAKP